MSSGKRLAKRSILGTRVSVVGLDGLWSSGMIQSVRTCQDDANSISGGLPMPNRYSVVFDDPSRISRYGHNFPLHDEVTFQ